MGKNKRLVMTITVVALIILGSVVFLAKRLANQSAKLQDKQPRQEQQNIEDNKINDIMQQYSSLPPEGKKKFEEMLQQLEKQYFAKKTDKSSAAGPVKTNLKKQGIQIKWQDAAKYVGKYVIVQGEIVSSYNNGDVCFMNFDKNFDKSLSLTIFGYNLGKFHEHPEKYYYDKTVSACGTIKEYKGRLEIILSEPNQIEVEK